MGTLISGGKLSPGQSISSSNGHYNFVFQSDGNVVLYAQYRGTIALWATGTQGTPAKMLEMQASDGNLVLRDGSQNPLWSSGSVGHPGAYLEVQDDGNVVIYDGAAVWHTNTANSDPLEGVSVYQTTSIIPTGGVLISVAGLTGRAIAQAGLAGYFEGNVTVTGDLYLPGGGDCAEHFDIGGGERIGPGTVVVIDGEGALRQSETAYDKKVAGVVSGAGGYRAGIVLDAPQSQEGRAPVALVGKAYCKADARYAPIEVGDLLTTSPTAGHAMKARDSVKAFGSVIGKALRPLRDGQGLIPILIALQ